MVLAFKFKVKQTNLPSNVNSSPEQVIYTGCVSQYSELAQYPNHCIFEEHRKLNEKQKDRSFEKKRMKQGFNRPADSEQKAK